MRDPLVVLRSNWLVALAKRVLGAEGVRQAGGHGVVVDDRVAEDALCAVIVLEARQLDHDLYDFAGEWAGEAVPEVLGVELAGAVGQRRVQHEPQRRDQVRLPDAVLTDDHRGPAQVLDLQRPKVAEVVDGDAGDMHLSSMWFAEQR